MDKRVQPFPSADDAVHLGGIGTCKNLARDVALSPKLDERLPQSGRVQPQHCKVCKVSRWLTGPYHLGESSQGCERYRYLERASSLVLATAAHILNWNDTEKISMAPAKG